MITDLDIWRAANLLIRKHGANAELEAAQRADLMLDRGDDDGRLLWMRIRRAVEALIAKLFGWIVERRENKIVDEFDTMTDEQIEAWLDEKAEATGERQQQHALEQLE